MHYFAYLDEFGHVGPYISRKDTKYNTSPIFGLGGFVLPSNAVRNFSTFFYQLKCNLCKEELENSKEPAHSWEMKGSSVYRPKNVKNYPSLRQGTNRILNRINNAGGFVFYVGIRKYMSPEQSSSESLYTAVLKESIKRLDEFCMREEATFSIVLDQSGSFEGTDPLRASVVAAACVEMFGMNHRRSLIEPPMQVESHLFQTIQCADWLCSLISKVETFQLCQDDFSDYEVLSKYFSERLDKAKRFSGVRSRIPRLKEEKILGFCD